MKTWLICLSLAATPSLAQTAGGPPPPAAVADSRIQTVRYDPGQIVRLKVATNYQATILFGASEVVENVAIGDGDAWQATLNGQSNALFLKPLRANGATNMTVITNARVYSFELTPAFSPGPDTVFTVRFVTDIPSDSAARPAAGRYRLSGAGGVRPAAMDDDGERTYVQWRDNQTLPALFAVDDQGDQVLLEGHMRDGRYVIDGVHRTLLFKLDGQTARAQRQRERSRR